MGRLDRGWKGRAMKAFQATLLLALGLFFFITGVMKLVDPRAFATAIEGYRLIEGLWAMVFALWIPWAECLVAIGLAWRSWRKEALMTLMLLLLAFQGALASALIRGLDISCGCFGAESGSSVGFALIRNGALMGFIAYLLAVERLRLRP